MRILDPSRIKNYSSRGFRKVGQEVRQFGLEPEELGERITEVKHQLEMQTPEQEILNGLMAGYGYDEDTARLVIENATATDVPLPPEGAEEVQFEPITGQPPSEPIVQRPWERESSIPKFAPPKWVASKSTWEKAKKQVQEQYGSVEDNWPLVTNIYKSMGGGIKEKKSSETKTAHYHVDEEDLVHIAESRYGFAVAEQLQSILGGEDLHEQNFNALEMMLPLLRRYEEYNSLAEQIEEHLGDL